MKKNILAIQMSSKIGDYPANQHKLEIFFDRAFSKYKDIDIVFLPEVWTLGWFPECFQENANKNAAAADFLSTLAKRYNVNIIGGSYIRCIKNENNTEYRNTCPVINRNGEIVANYDKIHLYSPDGEAKAVKCGDLPLIVDIEGLRMGLSICYDIRFPELFRSYISHNMAPHMLVNMSAWPKTRRAQYEAMAKSRAVENQCYFLALSQTGLIKDDVYNSGYSMLIEPLGDTQCSLNEDEGFIFEKIDTDVVDKVRETYPNIKNRKINDFGFCPKYIKTAEA